jgi:ribulose-phosphate 3-epimerase
MRRIQVAPSLLSSNFARLEEEVRNIERAGADLLHLDVMDGQFVPNITFGPVVIAAVKRVAKLPLDVHLMIEEPMRYIRQFAEAGANHLIVHVEACADVNETLDAIRSRGMKPGISLRPGTPFDAIEPYLGKVGVVLVMTVEPGFGGQSYRPEQEPKLQRAREIREAKGFNYDIEVDGGIARGTAPSAVAAGAEILVAGSALFGDPDPESFIRDLHSLGVGAELRPES